MAGTLNVPLTLHRYSHLVSDSILIIESVHARLIVTVVAPNNIFLMVTKLLENMYDVKIRYTYKVQYYKVCTVVYRL